MAQDEEFARSHTLECVRTFASSIHWRCKVLCHVHKWLFQESLGVLLETKIIGISEVQRVKNNGGESEVAKGKDLEDWQ